MNKNLWILLLVGSLAACSSTTKKSADVEQASLADNSAAAGSAEGGEKKKMKCRYVQLTGSHRYKKLCMTDEAQKGIQKGSEEWMRARQRQGGINPTSNGQ